MQNADLLDLPGWAVREVRNTDEHLLIKAESKEVPLSCPLCGSTKPPYHFGSRPRQVADLPIRMRPVQICIRRRRYRCRDCAGTFLDELQGIHPRHDATERLVEYMEVHALELTRTFTSLAHDVGVSEWLIRDIVMAQIERLERAYVLQTPRYLGIDEIYVEDSIYCVLTDIERRCVIDLLPKRDCESVKRWLMRLKGRDQIEASTMDLWNPYRIAIQALVPHARIIADKYHVLRLANEVVETVRKSLRSTLSPTQAKQLKQDRKILLKREKDLTEQQRFILESWTGFLPILRSLFSAKEEFFRIYDAGSEQDAYERYLTWQQHIPAELTEAFQSLQQTVEAWKTEIFNFFETETPLTNAYTERANLSIREATRITYGLSFRVLRAKLLFSPANTAKLRATPQRSQPQAVSPLCVQLTWISTDSGIASN